MSRLNLLPLALIMSALALSFATPSVARAYEDQATLGVDLGWLGAPSAEAGVPRNGVSLGLSGTLGLGDSWSLGGRVGYALHPADPTLHSGVGGLELIYLVDVLRLVPSLGLGVDGFFSLRDGELGADLAVHALLRLDFLFSRRLLFGVDFRVYALPFAFDDGGLAPLAMQAGLRVSLTFDRY
ncbi:MAG: hypothetical protein GXP55_14680 [Deltaproteobacteria bacterium]|nr:hypothetical protein [Deltaproteobacteria bacterium]